MRVIFFSNFFLKFGLDSIIQAKNSEKVFFFFYNCIWIGCQYLPLLRGEYLSLAVNMLTNSPKILVFTKRAIFQLSVL